MALFKRRKKTDNSEDWLYDDEPASRRASARRRPERSRDEAYYDDEPYYDDYDDEAFYYDDEPYYDDDPYYDDEPYYEDEGWVTEEVPKEKPRRQSFSERVDNAKLVAQGATRSKYHPKIDRFLNNGILIVGVLLILVLLIAFLV